MSSPEHFQWSEARRAERRQQRAAHYHRGLRPMAVATWEMSKEYNVGSLVRTAHAAAVREMLMIGPEREWNTDAARTADRFTRIVTLPDADAFRRHLHEHAYNLVAVELHPRAVTLWQASYPERPCFLLGAELGGLPEEMIDEAALVVQIPQWGLVPCLNVAVAGSIVLYDYLAKLQRSGELDRPAGGLVGEEPA